MKRLPFLSLLLLTVVVASADEPMCGTGPANDERLRAIHERPRGRARVAANAVAVPNVIDGSFHLEVDDVVNPGYRPFDLLGQSLVFEPKNGTFSVRRTAMQYVEPAGAPLKDFQAAGTTTAGWHYAEHDLAGFAFPFFNQSFTKLYVSAFNGITFAAPVVSTGMQFDDVEAAVHRQALLSPLMITSSKPARLNYPRVYVSERPGAVVITWRSDERDFKYDVQAELRSDGSFTYSYKNMVKMRWGAPVVSRGFDPAAATYRVLSGVNDPVNDTSNTTIAALRSMVDVRRVELLRVNESDLVSLKLQVNAAINTELLTTNQSLRYIVQIGSAVAQLDIFRSEYTITSFYSATSALNGASVRINGDTIELYAMQIPPEFAITHTLRIWTYTRPGSNPADFLSGGVQLDVPSRRVATDLSAASGGELPLPIAEPFTLGAFDPRALWTRLQETYGLSAYDIDAVAMYQTYFTDLIFYAGAYSTVGNPQVDGVRSGISTYGSGAPRHPALLHMNQLEYGWNATPENASHVALHELGHRWLYFINIAEDGTISRVLNPVSSHPGAFVHTPAAFRVRTDQESSVMGGSFFTEQPDGTFRARAANYGFSWTDLYLMGLAAPQEVPAWFYIKDSSPALPLQYYAADGIVVSGQNRRVRIEQIIDAEGKRNPTTALSQRLFRVLFVLVTESGEDPTPAELAKLAQWRQTLERDFALATGNRARVDTSWVRPSKRRSSR